MSTNRIPPESTLTDIMVKVLQDSDKPLSIKEIEKQVQTFLGLTEEEVHATNGKNTRSEYAYRLAWARSRAKKKGLIVRTGHGVWTTPKGNSS